MSPKTETKHARSGGRYYVWRSPDGEATERYFGVTSIIDNGIPKPALMGWAVKETALYAIQNLDILKAHVAKDLDEHGRLPVFDEKTRKPTTEGCLEAYKLLWNSRYAGKERAAKLGSDIHEAIEAYVLDKPMPEWPDEIAPYLENAVKFLTDFEVVVEMTEASVYNRTQKYAGTLDMIATIGEERWLIDFKTGSGVYPEAALQMAAYAHAEFIGKPDRTEHEMPTIDRAAIVHLQPDGYKFIPVRIDEQVFLFFQYAREVFRWCEFASKEVVGEPIDEVTGLKEREAVAS